MQKISLMYWTLELASYLSDAPWPASKDELIDFSTTMHSSKDSYAISKRDRPIAYVIKKNNYGFIEKLNDVGVNYVELERDTIIYSGGYKVVEFNNNFKVYEKMKMQKVVTLIEYNDNRF